MSLFLFKDRDGQTPLPEDLQKGLIQKQIQTIGELDEYEEENIGLGIIWMNDSQGDELSVKFWIKLHRQLFGNVWSWAGKIRSHSLANPDFCEPPYIMSQLSELQETLKFRLNENSYDKKECMALFHDEVERIHPFANGNGRWGRILTEHICVRNHLDRPTWGISFGSENPEGRRKAYIKALLTCRHERQPALLVEFMYS